MNNEWATEDGLIFDINVVATAYDSDGNICICDDCDQPSGYTEILYVEDAPCKVIQKCTDHSPMAIQPEATFHYNPDKQTNYRFAETPPILSDYWIVDLKKDSNG